MDQKEPSPSVSKLPGPVSAPSVRLYSPGQSTLACLLGSPAAGGYLLFRNLRRLEHTKATTPLWFGFGATVLLFTVGSFLPDSVGRSLTVLATVTWWHVAKSMQGPLFDGHVKAGGPRESSWRAAGVGLGFMAAILVLLLPVVMFTRLGEAPRLDYGNIAVIYEQGAAEEDARRVGDAMEGTLSGSQGGMELRLRRDPGLVVSFVLVEESWQDPDTVAVFEELREDLSRVLAEPVTFEFTDDWLRVKKTLGPP